MSWLFERTLEGLLAFLLAAGLGGCGQKEASPEKSDSAPAAALAQPKILDEILQKAEEKINQKDYESAISILENYRSDKKEFIVAKCMLTVDAELQCISQEFYNHEYNKKKERYSWSELKEKAAHINKSLETASTFDPECKEKYASILYYKGWAKKSTDTSTPQAALRTFIYALVSHDVELTRKVYRKEFKAYDDTIRFDNTIRKGFALNERPTWRSLFLGYEKSDGDRHKFFIIAVDNSKNNPLEAGSFWFAPKQGSQEKEWVFNYCDR